MSTVHSLPETPQAQGEDDIRRTYFTEDCFVDEWVQDYTGECSFCGQELSLPVIIWHMGSGTLWLHKDCCEKLGLALVKDAARFGYLHKNRVERAVRNLTTGVSL